MNTISFNYNLISILVNIMSLLCMIPLIRMILMKKHQRLKYISNHQIINRKNFLILYILFLFKKKLFLKYILIFILKVNSSQLNFLGSSEIPLKQSNTSVRIDF